MADTKKVKSKKLTNFIPPDGGWGWVIVIAAGLSNLSVLPMFQQFGLLFRDKFARLDFTSSQTTTIINVNAALTYCVGLANGPVYRKFSFRQVSLVGSTMIVISLIITTFCNTFFAYIFFYSALYGAGFGISSSANALALNTYWKERRRIATGLSWTMTGLGPIVWPHVITALFFFFGEAGTILILSGFALHSIIFALLLHPVEWHAKEATTEKNEEKYLVNSQITEVKPTTENSIIGSLTKIKNLSAFSSQYLYNEDDPNNPGYEIVDPGVPMMVRANDGYFSQSRQSRSKISSRDGSAKTSRMNSKKPSITNLIESRSRKSSILYLNELKKNSTSNLGAMALEREGYKQKRKSSVTFKTQILESEAEDWPTLKAPQDLKGDYISVVNTINPGKSNSVENKYADKRRKSLKSFKIDGQYSEQHNKDNHSNMSSKNQEDNDDVKYLRDNHSNQSYRTRYRRKSNNFNYENDVLKQASLKLEQYLKDNEDDTDNLKLLLNGHLENNIFNEKKEKIEDLDEEETEDLTFCQKVTMFFDLDLLKDFSYVNLMLGMNLSCFNELNFSLLTPFILGDFGIGKAEVATFLSILAGCDISVRFCVPFIAGKIGFDNNTFFLLGVLTMTIGRVILAHFHQSYSVVLIVAVIIGLGKGLRTVFMALVIPTYVPLHKLPGATGLQLLTSGIISFILGPILGYIKDHASTAVTLYSLNIFTWLTAVSWMLEKYFSSRHQPLSEDPVKV